MCFQAAAEDPAADLIKTSAKTWWQSFEAECGVKLPTYLKNLLILNGFDNTISLSELTDEDIVSIEKFAREDLEDLLELGTPLKSYYGIYEKKSKAFKIVPGHRILLKRIVDYCGKKDFLASSRRSKTRSKNKFAKENHHLGSNTLSNNINTLIGLNKFEKNLLQYV